LKEEFALVAYEEGMVAGSYLLGATIGSLCGNSLSNKLGRKKSIIITGVITFATNILSGVMPIFLLVVACRFLLGTGVGLACSVIPSYAAESVSSDTLKEKLLTFFQLMVTLGLVYANVAAYIIEEQVPAEFGKWRVFYFCSLLFPLGVFTVGVVMPESRVWYNKYGGGKASSGGGGGTELGDANSDSAPLTQNADGESQVCAFWID
jgi:MFS family permease